MRFKKSPYEQLLNNPRFTETTIALLGNDFIVADCHSFYYSYREIFLDEIYKFYCTKKSPTIIDCGSNYGTSLMYFKSLFPNAIITGIEADPKIFRLLCRNVKNRYVDINLINKAVSFKEGKVKFFCDGADGGRINQLSNLKDVIEVETILLDDLIDGEVDFLKIDIEGAETDVLCSSKKLSMVNQMFIEYHSLVNTNQSLARLLETLSNNNYRYYIQEIYCPAKPFKEVENINGMDLQLNIFAIKNP